MAIGFLLISSNDTVRAFPAHPWPFGRPATDVRRRLPLRAAGWITLFGLNLLGTLPWWQVSFPIVDLAERVYEVRRRQLGYLPYRDTFTHHFLGYIARSTRSHRSRR